MIFKNKHSQGSTLTISIMMMALVFASVYTVSTISVRNTKQFFNTVTGGTAIIVADGGAERGLWAHLRNQSSYVGNCDTNPPEYQTEDLAVPLENFAVNHCKTSLLPNPSTITLGSDATKEAYVIDPANSSGPSNYSEATFVWVAGSGTIRVCAWSAPDCATAGGADLIANFSQSGTNSQTVNLNNVDDRYIILYQADASGYSVSVSGKDESSNGKGLPADLATIVGIGNDAFTSRQIKVLVPQ